MEYSVSDESDNNSEVENVNYQERSSNGFPLCRGCSKEILDKYYLRVNETSWHEECLKCDHCNLALVSEETCFIKKSKIFCKLDYYKHFGIKCAKCNRNIQSSDWVRRAKENVYHLACFACESCKRQLSTGEEFALQNNKVLCKTHYCESIDGDSGENSKSKNKRVRTTFTEEQLQVLQANFDVESNPDGQDLERIAQITGLSKRVTQVWFQNSRARQKKYKEKKQGGGVGMMSAGGGPSSGGGTSSSMPTTSAAVGGSGGGGGEQMLLNESSSNNEDMWSNAAAAVGGSGGASTSVPPSSSQDTSAMSKKMSPTAPAYHHSTNSGDSGFLHELTPLNTVKKRKKCHDINLSWSSDDSSTCGDDATNEHSIYDSSLDYNNHEIE